MEFDDLILNLAVCSNEILANLYGPNAAHKDFGGVLDLHCIVFKCIICSHYGDISKLIKAFVNFNFFSLSNKAYKGPLKNVGSVAELLTKPTLRVL